MIHLSKPKIYTVHLKTDAREPYETARFVKEGFSWPAFIFGPFWALYHRLWLLALVLISFEVALLAVAEELGISEFGQAVLQMGFQAMIACMADERVRAKLRRDGYVVADIVVGDSLLHAEQRYFDRALA